MDLDLGPIADGLAQQGVLGVILGWFMFRLERTLRELTKGVEALTRAMVQHLVFIGDLRTLDRLEGDLKDAT